MTAIYGTFGKFAIGATAVTDKRIEFESCGLKLQEEIASFVGVQGHRGELSGRNRLGSVTCGGPLECTPTPLEWSYMLPYILGGTPSGTSYPLAEVLPTFYADLSDGTSAKQYSGCVMASATISAQAGGPLKLSANIEAIDESAVTFPSLSVDNSYGPFMFYEGAFTIAGVSNVTPFDFSIQIDNVIDTGRFLNSRTRTSLVSRARRVVFACNLPWGDYYSNLYAIQASEVAVACTFTSATLSMSLTMPKVRFGRVGPDGRGREEEMMFPLSGVARKTNAATDELQVVLDSTI